MRLQADEHNLNNVLDVIDFGGLFFRQCYRAAEEFRIAFDSRFLKRDIVSMCCTIQSHQTA